MKALTLTQPYATLVAVGAKLIETRGWKTSYRGPLAIHAAKGFPGWAREMCQTEPFLSALRLCTRTIMPDVDTWDLDCEPLLDTYSLPTSCVVAVCDLWDIYPTSEVIVQPCVPQKSPYRQRGSLYVRSEEWAFGDYSPGRWAWRLGNVRALPEPIPAKGSLGLWEWGGD
jgi:hypothetical protein